jgi:hypothetical protein
VCVYHPNTLRGGTSPLHCPHLDPLLLDHHGPPLLAVLPLPLCELQTETLPRVEDLLTKLRVERSPLASGEPDALELRRVPAQEVLVALRHACMDRGTEKGGQTAKDTLNDLLVWRPRARLFPGLSYVLCDGDFVSTGWTEPHMAAERAVVVKGAGAEGGAAPLVLIHEHPQSQAALFARHGALVLRHLLERCTASARYAQVAILCLEDQPISLLPDSDKALTLRAVWGGGEEDMEGLGDWVDAGTPEALLASLGGRLKRASGVALGMDQLSTLVTLWGPLEPLGFLRRLRGAGLAAPVIAVLTYGSLSEAVCSALEDEATTNLYIRPCQRWVSWF